MGLEPQLSAELLEIICCPDCHGDLEEQPDRLVCRSCGLGYPIRAGVPVLLVDEATPATGRA